MMLLTPWRPNLQVAINTKTRIKKQSHNIAKDAAHQGREAAHQEIAQPQAARAAAQDTRTSTGRPSPQPPVSPGRSAPSTVLPLPGSPVGQSPTATPAASSPATSENTFTLLPGYASRPGPSPLKVAQQKKAHFESDPGGFLLPGAQQAAAQPEPASIQDSSRQIATSIVDAEAALWKDLAEELKAVHEYSNRGQNAADYRPADVPSTARQRQAQAASSTRPIRLKRLRSTTALKEHQAPLLLDPLRKFTAKVKITVASWELPKLVNVSSQGFNNKLISYCCAGSCRCC